MSDAVATAAAALAALTPAQLLQLQQSDAGKALGLEIHEDVAAQAGGTVIAVTKVPAPNPELAPHQVVHMSILERVEDALGIVASSKARKFWLDLPQMAGDLATHQYAAAVSLLVMDSFGQQ